MRGLVSGILIICTLLLVSCKANAIYVPIENSKTEYVDRLYRDSIYLKDSIRIYVKGDTVYQDRYKYLYRNKLVHDSIYVCDTIRVPYPVLEVKEVNRIRSWQLFLMCLGGVLIGIVGIRLFQLVK